jgi:signal transduction histidine kinase
VCDIGLLYLALTILSTSRRPPFTGFLLSAIGVFVILDALRLRVQPFEKLPFGVSEFGDWPKLLWALGIILLGLTAAKGASESFVQQLEIGPRGVYAFWLGPLSPLIHYGLLLVWGAFYPPLPRYVLLGGAALMLCLALRLSVSSGYIRKLRREVERLVKKRERSTISEELHDTLKQSVYSTALLLATYRKAREKKSLVAAEEILDRAVHASREANHRISRPIEEMRVLSSEPESDIVALLRRLGDEVRRYFGVAVHEDLRADLDVLDVEERAAAYRIAGEALWNAAKHSGAKNVWIESEEMGRIFSVGVRDDGRGMDAGEPSEGVGFSIMRSRAQEAGGTFEVDSQPGKGTLVRVSFEKG